MAGKRRTKTIKEMVTIDPETGCWNWNLHCGQNGYGVIWFEGKNRYVHRVSNQLYVGPIPDGMTIDHLCRNKQCANPDHMEAVTVAVNCQRRSGTKLSPESVRKIRALIGDGVHQRDIASIFGISQPSVSLIKRGINWSDVT